ncbi:hypothetical protein C8R44DRAFT_728449 [Mycena epipterygia]|nr:hypothetical protein C8R44DRAFT_728449 [Mycena epipterygia]
MPPQLAQELLDAIVDHVHGNSNLISCSLASTSFAVSSQRCLFRSLCLTETGHLDASGAPSPDGSHISFDDARDLFTMSPHLGNHVRDLTVCWGYDRDYAAAESVLRRVPSLTRLALSAIPFFFSWEEMPSNLMDSLRNIYVGPSLRSMYLDGIAAIPSSLIMHAASSLREISVNQITCKDDDTSGTPFISNLPHPAHGTTLEDIDFSTIWDFPTHEAHHNGILDLDIHPYLRGLRRLMLRLSADARPEVFLLRSDFHSTLTRLELRFACRFPALHLPFLPVLRFLKLQFYVRNPVLLTALPTSTPLLESLTLALDLLWVGDFQWAEHTEPHPLFHSTIELGERLPRLREMHCSQSQPPGTGFAEYMKQKFPSPEETGILVLTSVFI